MAHYQTAELHFIDGPWALTVKIEAVETLKVNRTYRILIPNNSYRTQTNLDNSISFTANEYHYIAIPLPANHTMGRQRFAMLLENGL